MATKDEAKEKHQLVKKCFGEKRAKDSFMGQDFSVSHNFLHQKIELERAAKSNVNSIKPQEHTDLDFVPCLSLA